MARKRLAPHARRIRDAFDRGQRLRGMSPDRSRLTIVVCIGPESWRWAQRSPFPALVAPAKENLCAFDWSLCAGNDPVLLRRCGEVDPGRVQQLVEALVADGVERVLDLHSGQRWVSARAAA